MYTSGLRFGFDCTEGGGGVLDHLVRKTYHIYMHSDPNSACMKNATSKQPDSFLQMEGHLDRHCALGIPER